MVLHEIPGSKNMDLLLSFVRKMLLFIMGHTFESTKVHPDPLFEGEQCYLFLALSSRDISCT